jgi:hypothetical protein
MSDKPAFPFLGIADGLVDNRGMTERQVYACFALMGHICSGRKAGVRIEQLALECFDAADAMIAAQDFVRNPNS